MSIGALDHRKQTLRFRLRAATDVLHRETERLFALEHRAAARETYRDLIAALYGFHEPLERALIALQWNASFDIAPRLRKAEWLAADLSALGLSPQAIAELPVCPHLPDLSSIPLALGALYVVEGATLGGQLIMRALQERLYVTPEIGGRFFASYGMRIGLMWRRFVDALEDCGSDSSAAAEVEAGAVATFRTFGAWLPALPVAAHV